MLVRSPLLRHVLAILVASNALHVHALCPVLQESSHETAYDVQSQQAVIEKRYSAGPPDDGNCPRKSKVAGGGTRSKQWWPCELSLDVLRQNSEKVLPYGSDFDYATEFKKLDVAQLKKDLLALQLDSQSWWPADFGNYGPFLTRLAWHNAGTYRSVDGRGGSGMGQQRFAALNSWPDNASLDKARRLLWPIKQKYGAALSWADLFVFAGHTAVESMGVKQYGFAFGRVDTWQADEAIYWGGEVEMFPSNASNAVRYDGSTNIMERANTLESPLASVDMGLIYVDPRGPNGVPDPLASAGDIRMTFGRMGMDDEETVALIAGGHAFGKTHGASAPDALGPEPNAAPIEAQGFGWYNSNGTGVADDATTSGLEVIWSNTPLNWTNEYLKSLLTNKWTLQMSPGGAPQYIALDAVANYPDPFIKGKYRHPTMLTSDLALLYDPVYKNISETFYHNFDYFTEKFAVTWYKLLHRDMGPTSRYLGPYVPNTEPLIWQDPLPEVSYQTIDDSDIKRLKMQILNSSGLNMSDLVTTAWGSASSFRISDKRGGANGARIALEPQRSWIVNNPSRLDNVLKALTSIQTKFNSASPSKKVSMADLIVLGGSAAIEKATNMTITVPFTPGRVDTTQNRTDVSTFAYLQPRVDGFRNYGVGDARSTTEEYLVDKANQLSLTPPEMTVLVGGMRALNANYDGSNLGILTSRPGHLTNDFFVNLLSMDTQWTPVNGTSNEVFSGKSRMTGKEMYRATRSDLIFGSHPELRAYSEVYGSGDAQGKFVRDFIKAWTKVMDLDRYDVKGRVQNNVQ